MTWEKVLKNISTREIYKIKKDIAAVQELIEKVHYHLDGLEYNDDIPRFSPSSIVKGEDERLFFKELSIKMKSYVKVKGDALYYAIKMQDKNLNDRREVFENRFEKLDVKGKKIIDFKKLRDALN
tara:strand:+ start:141 stop:515 length:375 start_codon:yes stop_codon:yes gene_type:complete